MVRAGRTEHCEDSGVLSWFCHQTVDSQILIDKLMVLPVLSLIGRVHDLVGFPVALEIFDRYHDPTVISKVEEIVLLKNLQDLVYKLSSLMPFTPALTCSINLLNLLIAL